MITESSTDISIKERSFGIGGHQVLVDDRWQIEIAVDCTASEFQVQYLADRVVGSRGKGGRFYRSGKHPVIFARVALSAGRQNQVFPVDAVGEWG